MRILVYGAGGVGAFFGALLARAGRDVHFVARGAQLEALRLRGLRIRSEGVPRAFHVTGLDSASVHPRAFPRSLRSRTGLSVIG